MEHNALKEIDFEQCMRCGLCLSSCPTFSIYKTETTSPRGRIALMKGVSEGQLENSGEFYNAVSMCLGCLACQTACPAGVEYGLLLEHARSSVELVQKTKRFPVGNLFRSWLLNHVLRKPRNLEIIAPILRLYQKMGIQKFNLGRLVSHKVGQWEQMLPPIPSKSLHQTMKEVNKPDNTVSRGKIGLLSGCIENTFLSDINIATARILLQNNFEVIIPELQECCGALPGHVGEVEVAKQRARKNIDVFEKYDCDYIISDAAGCSGQLKEYGHLLKNDAEYKNRAETFSKKCMDLTEFLANNLPLMGELIPLNKKVAYDDPCHLIHAQGISHEPRLLLATLSGINFVELPEADWCCGSAGTYNLSHPKEADILLQRKMEHLKTMSVDILVTANTGCYLQLAIGIKKSKLDVEIMHISQLIYQAYGYSS